MIEHIRVVWYLGILPQRDILEARASAVL